MEFLAPVASDDDRTQGKARSLARLAKHGLAVPPAVATLDPLFRALCPIRAWPGRLDQEGLAILAEAERLVRESAFPEGFASELAKTLVTLGASRYAVRSSFVGEDQVGRLAAGVFESRVGVPPSEVGAAIREVLVSAISPAAVAYGLARGWAPAVGPVCVLLHPYLPGEVEGTVAMAEGAPLLECRRGSLEPEAEQALLSALRAFVKEHGPTEMEWVVEGGHLYFLQARPFEAPRAPAVFTGFSALSPADPPPAAWTWDAAHNPLPLSPAQQGLVALVDGACRIGIRQRVLGGYLFYAKDSRPLPDPIPPGEAAAALGRLKAEFEARREALRRAPSLEAACALFIAIYEPLFGVIQPAVKKRRAALVEFLRAHAPGALPRLADLLRDVPSVATTRRLLSGRIATAETAEARRAAIAAYLEQFGDEGPGWDVAEPTYAERQTDSIAVSFPAPSFDAEGFIGEIAQSLPPDDRPAFLSLVEQAREGVVLSEEDDWLYARAQTCVRSALLELGRALAGQDALDRPEEVFFLPLSLCREMAANGRGPGDLRETVAKARNSLELARENPPGVSGGHDGVVRGVGVGGKIVGRVFRHSSQSLGHSTKVDVLVARTLLPTELPLVEAAALVVETGGALDHVASQARERNLPAVVGAQGALATFAEGDFVLVDGDRGLVIRLNQA